MTELEHYISSYFEVPAEDVAAIGAFFQPHAVPKGAYLLQAGKVCDQLSFQRAGVLRVFTATPDKEITQWLSTPGYFITDLAGIVFGRVSRWTMQALTDCEFYSISRADYQRLGEVLPQWHRLEKLFLAKCFLALEERIFTHLSMSAEERYHALLAGRRELFQQVPAQYLASMLGMTPETLSRLRGKDRPRPGAIS